MNDQFLWQLGIKRICDLTDTLTEDHAAELKAILSDYRSCKESIAAISQQVDSETICRRCAGQCCMNGKYRANVFDVISIIDSGTAFLPDFTIKPLCPYGTAAGCLLSRRLRPADCILFVCEEIDRKLSDHARTELAAGDSKLRQNLKNASRLLGFSVSTPLLLWADKS